MSEQIADLTQQLLNLQDQLPEQRNEVLKKLFREQDPAALAVAGKYAWKNATPDFMLDFLAQNMPGPEEKERRSVLVINRAWGYGGIARVAVLQIAYFLQLGYRVCCIHQANSGEKQFPFPEGVVLHHLSDDASPEERAAFLQDVVRREKIDFVVRHTVSIRNLQLDLLVLKWACRLPVILQNHGNFFFHIKGGTTSHVFSRQFRIFSQADRVITLSRMDEQLFRAAGVKAVYLPNPVVFATENSTPAEPVRQKSIIWCGRMDPIKRPQDLVPIMTKVVKHVPDAHLYVLGDGICLEPLRDAVAEAGIGESVTFTGYCADVNRYLTQGACFLSTSESESFGCSILEALNAGLPVVSYDLPFNELNREENGGVLNVPMGDTAAAAAALIRLLTEPQFRQQQAEMALAHAEKYRTFDYKGAYDSLIRNLTREMPPLPEENWQQNVGIMIHSMGHFLQIGKQKIVDLKNEMIHEKKEIILRKNEKIAQLRALLEKERNRIAEQQQRIVEQQQRIAEQEAQITALNARVAELSQPWLKRKIKGGLRCLREHGFIYTVKRLFQKIGNKFRKG